jgi:hypothetical protein
VPLKAIGGRDLLGILSRMGFAHLVDQRLHRRVRLQQLRIYRQQPVARVSDLALGKIEIEHAEEFSVRTGIGDERGAAGIGDGDRLRNGIMGVAAEDDVDAGDAAGELEVDVHAVMRQQHHRIDLVGGSQAVDQLLQFLVADSERPVRREALWMCDRHIGKGLPDHGHATAADLLDHRRLEHASRRRIERLGVVERGFLGQEDILRKEFALEAFEVCAQRRFAIGEFPMAGHRLDAQQIGSIDHVAALRGVGEPGSLPQIAAI